MDVDDLLSLAEALEVTPVDLLVPYNPGPEEAMTAEQARAWISGIPAPWTEVRKRMFRLALIAAFSPSSYKTLHEIEEDRWWTEEEAISVQQVIRNSVAMRRPHEAVEGEE